MTLQVKDRSGETDKIKLIISGVDKYDLSSHETEDAKELIELIRESITASQRRAE